MTDAGLWAVHVHGPDDVLAAESREDAETEAREINEWWATHRAEHPATPGISPNLHAVAEPWPFSDGDHAAGLARRLEDGELPADVPQEPEAGCGTGTTDLLGRVFAAQALREGNGEPR